MVHDEEAEISIRLATLIANSQRSRSAMPLEEPATTVNDAVAGGGAATQTEAPKGIPSSLLICCWSCCERKLCCRWHSVQVLCLHLQWST